MLVEKPSRPIAGLFLSEGSTYSVHTPYSIFVVWYNSETEHGTIIAGREEALIAINPALVGKLTCQVDA